MQNQKTGHSDSNNEKTLATFVTYCEARPELRFWQALRNWSGFNFVWVGYEADVITFDTFNFEGRNG